MKMPGIPGFSRPPPDPKNGLEDSNRNIQVTELGGLHRPAIERHFVALDSEDRRLRFGAGLHDQALAEYVARIDFTRDAVFGVMDDSLDIIGMAHLARGGPNAELGLSVSPAHRGTGIGGALLRRAHMHARNWGVQELFMHCLAENGAVMHLAQKQGMQVAASSGAAEARLKLPPADGSSHLLAMIEQQVALVDYALKSQLAHARRVVRAFVPHVHTRQRRG